MLKERMPVSPGNSTRRRKQVSTNRVAVTFLLLIAIFSKGRAQDPIQTSGVQGAIRFLETRFSAFAGRINLLVAPCVSPWGYETINRWNHVSSCCGVLSITR
jgi:hypothetical protein